MPDMYSDDPKECSTANWVNEQLKAKRQFDRGNSPIVPEEKLKILLQVRDFPFRLTRAENTSRNLQDLKLFMRDNGHMQVTEDDNPHLFLWIKNLRSQYKKEEVDPELVTALNNLGFEWSPLDETWLKMFIMLQDWYINFETFNVPRDSHKKGEEYRGLGRWTSTQRENYSNKMLDERKIEKLNEIGFIWRLRNPKTKTSKEAAQEETTANAKRAEKPAGSK